MITWQRLPHDGARFIPHNVSKCWYRPTLIPRTRHSVFCKGCDRTCMEHTPYILWVIISIFAVIDTKHPNKDIITVSPVRCAVLRWLCNPETAPPTATASWLAARSALLEPFGKGMIITDTQQTSCCHFCNPDVPSGTRVNYGCSFSSTYLLQHACVCRWAVRMSSPPIGQSWKACASPCSSHLPTLQEVLYRCACSMCQCLENASVDRKCGMPRVCHKRNLQQPTVAVVNRQTPQIIPVFLLKSHCRFHRNFVGKGTSTLSSEYIPPCLCTQPPTRLPVSHQGLVMIILLNHLSASDVLPHYVIHLQEEASPTEDACALFKQLSGSTVGSTLLLNENPSIVSTAAAAQAPSSLNSVKMAISRKGFSSAHTRSGLYTLTALPPNALVHTVTRSSKTMKGGVIELTPLAYLVLSASSCSVHFKETVIRGVCIPSKKNYKCSLLPWPCATVEADPEQAAPMSLVQGDIPAYNVHCNGQ